MSLLLSTMNISQQGMNVSQVGLNVVSNNIANMNTEGYQIASVYNVLRGINNLISARKPRIGESSSTIM